MQTLGSKPQFHVQTPGSRSLFQGLGSRLQVHNQGLQVQSSGLALVWTSGLTTGPDYRFQVRTLGSSRSGLQAPDLYSRSRLQMQIPGLESKSGFQTPDPRADFWSRLQVQTPSPDSRSPFEVQTPGSGSRSEIQTPGQNSRSGLKAPGPHLRCTLQVQSPGTVSRSPGLDHKFGPQVSEVQTQVSMFGPKFQTLGSWSRLQSRSGL